MKNKPAIFRYHLTRVLSTALILILIILSATAFFGYFYFSFKAAKIIMKAAAIILSLYIASMPCNIPCKTGWIIGIISLPPLFILLFIFFGRGTKIKSINNAMRNSVKAECISSPSKKFPEHISKQFYSLAVQGGFSVYNNTQCTYLSDGNAFFCAIKDIISKAKKFIFLEFFIINKGLMWGELLDILKKKASEGVQVYLLRDDLGTTCLLPPHYNRKLEAMGIHCLLHGKFKPYPTPDFNYRDHRKIVVADSKYAVTGGANLADEYINRISPYGYWKDTGVKLEGKGAQSFTKMFIKMWNYNGGGLNESDFTTDTDIYEGCGICQPFCDYPSCQTGFSETAFINLIANSQKKVYITTPYLIPDKQLITTLCRAAENGVDVRLITPNTPDKKYIQLMTRANYAPLLKSGVRIYEYMAGFIHAKSMQSDDNLCYVGSANLDYRSLYLHFECGVLMYNTKACEELRDDLQEILYVSRQMSMSDKEIAKAPNNIFYRLLRIISGLL